MKNLSGHIGAAVSGQPNNADGTDLIAGGYGGDYMGHSFLLMHVHCIFVSDIQKSQRISGGGNEMHQHIGAHNGYVFFPQNPGGLCPVSQHNLYFLR